MPRSPGRSATGVTDYGRHRCSPGGTERLFSREHRTPSPGVLDRRFQAPHGALAECAPHRRQARNARRQARNATLAALAEYATRRRTARNATLAALATLATLAEHATLATLGALAEHATHTALAEHATLAALAEHATLAALAEHATLAALAEQHARHAALAEHAITLGVACLGCGRLARPAVRSIAPARGPVR